MPIIGYECDIDTGNAAPVRCGKIHYGICKLEVTRKHIVALINMGHIYVIKRSK